MSFKNDEAIKLVTYTSGVDIVNHRGGGVEKKPG